MQFLVEIRIGPHRHGVVHGRGEHLLVSGVRAYLFLVHHNKVGHIAQGFPAGHPAPAQNSLALNYLKPVVPVALQIVHQLADDLVIAQKKSFSGEHGSGYNAHPQAPPVNTGYQRYQQGQEKVGFRGSKKSSREIIDENRGGKRVQEGQQTLADDPRQVAYLAEVIQTQYAVHA